MILFVLCQNRIVLNNIDLLLNVKKNPAKVKETDESEKVPNENE